MKISLASEIQFFRSFNDKSKFMNVVVEIAIVMKLLQCMTSGE